MEPCCALSDNDIESLKKRDQGREGGLKGRKGGRDGGFIEYQMTRFGRHNKGSLPGGAASPQGTDPIIASLYLIFTLMLPSEKTVRHTTQSDLLIKKLNSCYSSSFIQSC